MFVTLETNFYTQFYKVYTKNHNGYNIRLDKSMAMTSPDDSLQKHFIEDVKGGKKDGVSQGTIDDLIEWLRTLKVFEKTNIKESDVREAYEKLIKKLPTLNFEDFMKILEEIARKTKTTIDELKAQMNEQIQESETMEREFRENLEKGRATFKQVMDWFEKNKIVDKAKLMEEDVAKAFDQMKQQASTFNRQDLMKKMNEMAAKNNINLEELVKKLTDPGFLPPTDSDESVEVEKTKSKKE